MRSSAASPARPPNEEVEEGGSGSILSSDGSWGRRSAGTARHGCGFLPPSTRWADEGFPGVGLLDPRRGSSASINGTQGCKFRCSIDMHGQTTLES
ncbi:unnamed protein product [Urochloa humidicola]